ncbi:hypothetical protein QT970_28185, partial [Microcoleus sp. herbarium8]
MIYRRDGCSTIDDSCSACSTIDAEDWAGTHHPPHLHWIGRARTIHRPYLGLGGHAPSTAPTL